MNTEKMIAKGVEKHFDGQRVLFKVESLNEHFKGLVIHESDWVSVEDEAYVVLSDVNFDNATDNEIQRDSEVEETPLLSGMTFEEAEKLMDIGELIALPEWGGFWFKSVKTGETIVLTKEGEITETPWEEFKERNDWVTVEATPEQKEIIENYFATNEPPVEEIEVIEPEVVEPEIVAPEVIVAETPKKKTKK